MASKVIIHKYTTCHQFNNKLQYPW